MTTSAEPWSEFWKFRGIDKRLLHLLVQKQLWFSSPQCFNDPFDCQVDIENTFAGIRAELREHLDGEFSEIVNHVEEHVRTNRYAYLCMCRVWNQTLMWSHYAENHKGIALGFTFDVKSPFKFTELIDGDVEYKATALREQMTRANEALGMSRQFRPGTPGISRSEGLQITGDFYDCLMRLYQIVRFMKAECWAYEQEFRFEVELDGDTAIGVSREFAPSDLQNVLFGTRCSDADIEMIRNLLSCAEWSHLQYWRCVRDGVNLILKAERIA